MRFRPYWKLLVLPLCRHLPMPLYEPNWSISGEERRPLLPSCSIVDLSAARLRLLCMFSRFFQQQFKATTLEPREMVCTSSGGIVKTFALSRRQSPLVVKKTYTQEWLARARGGGRRILPPFKVSKTYCMAGHSIGRDGHGGHCGAVGSPLAGYCALPARCLRLPEFSLGGPRQTWPRRTPRKTGLSSSRARTAPVSCLDGSNVTY